MPATLATERPFTEEDLREMVLRLAHEIRNPLAAIKSAAQLLEHLNKPEGETVEYFASIHDEIDRINRVLSDMQRYARLDSPVVGRIDVGRTVRLAVEEETSGDATIRERIDVHAGPKSSVLANQTTLSDAVRELLSNSIRYSPPTSRIRVSWENGDELSVRIVVEDRGPGISDAVEGKMLRPFFSTSTQGTGLGLNIVARTARLLGGNLSWNNVEDGGARFVITVPRA